MVAVGFREIVDTRINAITSIDAVQHEIDKWLEAYEYHLIEGDTERAEKARYRVEALARRYRRLTAPTW